ncbi:FkbM family methyltransferase [Aporhodopirellula aestuarii]|uniref:FkbM family methyltransferase n=1 Tax=Aporhodopirellula aestuarii TaxID=2950107 RepID=A0ABT0U781_9BACT|nr:FkbM family methyltransferase [Aporhodopirellula aestuarii]MCM2372206.1 FkbM family methyltransferase [Aporhodopirellula aestuarii]
MTSPLLNYRISRSVAKRADSFLSLIGIRDRIPVATHARSHRQWVANDGDTTHRTEYQLEASDIVFDVGGYRGDWAAEIYDKFGCEIHVFEPISNYCAEISDRFVDVDRVHAHCCGLSAEDGSFSLGISDDSTSQFVSGSQSETCVLKSVSDFLEERGISRVALLKLNIEGGEYDLLEHLIETNLIEVFENIQVQFHWFVPHARSRMKQIQTALAKTHAITYQYPFVWENWVRDAA